MTAGRLARLVGAALLALGPSCTDSVGPVVTELKVRLSLRSPSSEPDSAVLVTVKGPAPLRSARAAPGLQVFYSAFGADSTRFAVTGRLVNGADVLFVGIEDVRQAGQYTAWVDQVAAPNYALRPAIGDYQLTLHR